jgi:hypothetical protein
MMPWKFDGASTKGGTGARRDWVDEGNVPIYIFQEEPDRVRFLLEEPDFAAIAEERSVTPDEAQEIAYTQLMWERWYMPVPQWEHVIPSIPGKRYFSTQACLGMQVCPMCAENQAAKDRGVAENKMLPFPVRKRFLAPAWVSRLNKVLWVKQSQEFWEEVGQYIEKNGTDIEFDIYKTGKGFNTKYKSIYVGKAKGKAKEPELAPDEMDFTPSDEDMARKLGQETSNPTSGASSGGGARKTEKPKSSSDDSSDDTGEETKPSALSGDSEDPGEFVIPFGSHKGKSVRELFDSGEVQYLQFLESRSSGLVQETVSAFLKEEMG